LTGTAVAIARYIQYRWINHTLDQKINDGKETKETELHRTASFSASIAIMTPGIYPRH
jgi:hypothetical protein